LGAAVTTGLLYQPQIIGDGDCGEIGGMKICRGNRSTRRKPASAALLSTTNSTRLDQGLNPGGRGGKPATNRLSYGAAFKRTILNGVSELYRFQICTQIFFIMSQFNIVAYRTVAMQGPSKR
jgi:hypothetical protein